MIPKYDINYAQTDPLLNDNYNPTSYINSIDEQINKLNALKTQFARTQPIPQQYQPQVQNKQNDIWNQIDVEVNSLTDEQKNILAKDQTYNAISQELQLLIQQELINSVKYKVGDTPRGKELLNEQLNYIRTKKKEIIQRANAEAELFNQFKIATQANPNLTYAEFIKSIKK